MTDSATILATTKNRSPTTFGIFEPDRFAHLYLIGRTGTGKSTLLETLIVQDLFAGNGLALIDPHGDLARATVSWAAKLGRSDLVLVDPADPLSASVNPLRPTPDRYRPLAASGLLEVLKKLWDEKSWGPRMEHILRNAIFLLLEQPTTDLSDILLLFSDNTFRQEAVANCGNDQVRQFWTEEFERYNPRMRADAVAPIQNKIGALLADPRLKRILTSPHPISIRSIMDEGKVLIVNLAKGLVGSDSANLLGGLILTTIGLAAHTRVAVPEEKRRPFFVYADEFQAFSTRAIGDMAAELRKFKVGMTLAHQFLHQLDPEVRYSVLGNSGTLIAFRVGPQDAPLIAREFEPVFGPTDLLGLPNFRIYLRLLVNGAPSRPFSAKTLTPSAALRLARLARVRELKNAA